MKKEMGASLLAILPRLSSKQQIIRCHLFCLWSVWGTVLTGNNAFSLGYEMCSLLSEQNIAKASDYVLRKTQRTMSIHITYQLCWKPLSFTFLGSILRQWTIKAPQVGDLFHRSLPAHFQETFISAPCFYNFLNPFPKPLCCNPKRTDTHIKPKLTKVDTKGTKQRNMSLSLSKSYLTYK